MTHQGGARASSWPVRAWRAGCCAVLLALAGCHAPPQPPLALGMNARLGFDPLALARERGLLDAERVKVVELASATEVQRAFNNGLLDAAALTLDETLRLVDAGAELRIVALLDSSLGGDVVLARPGIASPAGLRGEAVAVEASSVGALVLQRMLDKAGLQRSDVEVVNLEAHAHLDALREGRVAAAVSYAPIAGELQAAGFRPVFSSRDIPGEVMGVLAVRRAVLQARPEAVDALLRGWSEGLLALSADPAGAADMLSRGSELPARDYAAGFRGRELVPLVQSLRELSGPARDFEARAQAIGRTLIELGALRRPPELLPLLDRSALQRVLDEQEHS